MILAESGDELHGQRLVLVVIERTDELSCFINTHPFGALPPLFCSSSSSATLISMSIAILGTKTTCLRMIEALGEATSLVVTVNDRTDNRSRLGDIVGAAQEKGNKTWGRPDRAPRRSDHPQRQQPPT